MEDIATIKYLTPGEYESQKIMAEIPQMRWRIPKDENAANDVLKVAARFFKGLASRLENAVE